MGRSSLNELDIGLQKNKNHKVLVVDDSRLFRQEIQRLLENLFFNVISVAHGEEAIGMLQSQPEISLVLTDYNMPVMDGLDLTIEIRKTYTKNELSILTLSSNEDDEVIALFLKHGANDYIKKPFSKEEFYCRVNNAVEALENIQTITNYANRDYLTGLYNRRYFFETMNEYIDEIKDSEEKFAIGMIDIDHFKKINDTYGHSVGDAIITSLADILRSSTNSHDLVARFGGEEFCVVLKNVNQYSANKIFERIRKEGISQSELTDAQNYLIGNHLRRLRSYSGVAFEAALDQMYGLDYNRVTDYPDKIKSITADEIHSAVSEYISPEKATIVILKPAD